jgi:hypothetical protein
MGKSPVKVKLIGKEADLYKIQFPNLQIPVTVNESLYRKMLHSSEYEIVRPTSLKESSFSA